MQRVVRADDAGASGWINRLLAEAAGELAGRRGFVFLPLWLSGGILLYFAAPSEPGLLTPTLLAVALSGLAVRALLRGGRHRLITGLTLLVAGFALAKARTELVAAPRLETARTYALEGWIERADLRAGGGARLTLRPYAIEGLPHDALPERVTVTVRGDGAVTTPGEAVTMLARLGPPTPPLLPGGHDFARVAYYDGVGATGFSYGASRSAADPPVRPFGISLRAALERFRRSVSARIIAALPGDAGGIAAALIVGERGLVSGEAEEAMRVSGLAHVLSISGLHMTFVIMTIFVALRALLATSRTLALGRPIKSWAALGALVGVVAYLLVSGMDVAAQRSAMMAGLVLVAVLAGRSGDPMRLLALAALVIFALTPEAVLEPGAQMSFLAVAALVATYERHRLRADRRAFAGHPPSWPRSLATALGGVVLTSLVAGLATAPVAVDAFHRASPLTVVANLAATPLVGFVIMPAGVAAAVAMPFGLEALPLAVMGLGIEGMLWIAGVVAAWTPGGGSVGAPHALMAPLAITGILWIALWTSPIRWAGVLPVALALVIAPFGPRPDVIVSGEGRRVLIHGDDGAPRLVGRGSAFEAEIWLRSLADARTPDDPGLRQDVGCDASACIGLGVPRGRPATGELTVAVVERPDAFAEECRRADLIVTWLVAPPWCARTAVVIDHEALALTGARTYALPEGEGLALEPFDTALRTTRRPWQGVAQ